jgi:Fe-S cluster assembly scaffold protein SufB
LRFVVEEGALLTIRSVFVLSGNTSIVQMLAVAHAEKEGASDIRVRGVLDGEASFECAVRVSIEKRAFGSATFIEERALLLSRGARATLKPDLEIANASVSAKHAAATSRIDRQSLYYLEARGFGKEEATAVLREGFLNELLATFPKEIAVQT